MTTNIIWFRNDLRLEDNPALNAAVAGAERIVPVYVLDDEAAGRWRAGGASRWWLHHSLAALAAGLEARGARLVLRRGAAAEIVPALAGEVQAGAVYAARAFEPAMRATDKAVHTALQRLDIPFHRLLSMSLFAPDQIRNRSGGVYGVYTPFAKACRERGIEGEPVAAPGHLPGAGGIKSDRLADWCLLPTRPDWAGGLRESWQPGEAGAAKLLARFLDTGIAHYDKARNTPGQPGTSRLSPHVHFGEISPRSVWQQASAHRGKGAETFLKELLWREFSIYLLWYNQELPDQPLRSNFAAFPWSADRSALRAWQRGETGYPIVDAGMRELWQTGWMHNRVRMITASFLIKHLLIPWQDGEAWFWDCLCEADLAANAASWQWVAGCGADAAPYFRIFNPVLQGRKFDAGGDYVRRYVPELADLPDAVIHTPWEADAATLTKARVTLGNSYPYPLISLSEGRDRALAAYKKLTG